MNANQMRNCIEAISEFEGGGISWYRVRGHVDKATFQEALRLEFDVSVELENIEHIHVRNIPAGGEMYYIVCRPGRGAYPITSVDAPYMGHRVVHGPEIEEQENAQES